MTKNIILIAESVDETISPATLDLVAFGQALQADSDSSLTIIITGAKIQHAAEEFARQTGIDIILIPSNPSSMTQADIIKAVPAIFFEELNPAYTCLIHNSFGQEVAPGLATKLNAACITGVEKIVHQNSQIYFYRKIFNDKISSVQTSNSPITVLTVQAGLFKPVLQGNHRAGIVKTIKPDFLHSRSHFMGYASTIPDTSNLADAEVIISAGNGVGEKENLELIYRLAELFPKSSVAGSRPVCDRKWLEYNRQVGATGATVKPKLYIACGISGASQHIAGMRDSKFIVSINTDPRAAIFQYSDICLVEDLSSFIPRLIDAYQKSVMAAKNQLE